MAERHLVAVSSSHTRARTESETTHQPKGRMQLHPLRRKQPRQVAAHTSHRPSILVVEDDRVQQSVVSGLLESEGFEVIVADTGRQGLKILAQTPVDLVICDMMMPEMNGVDFVRKVRSADEVANIPVVMLTSIEGEELEFSLLRVGVDVFCPKASAGTLLLRQVRLLLM